MTTNYTEDLTMLRRAADAREWTALQDTLKRLLAAFDPLVALQIAAERVQTFLPTFEDYYPEAGWVRELLLTVVSYASAPGELPETAVNQFPSPGCGNYIRAVLDTARVVQPKYTVFERYSHVTNAVANSILAELQHAYFGPRPGEYTFILDPDADAEKKAHIQRKFWLNAGVAAHDTALWLEVAESVRAQFEEQR